VSGRQDPDLELLASFKTHLAYLSGDPVEMVWMGLLTVEPTVMYMPELVLMYHSPESSALLACPALISGVTCVIIQVGIVVIV